MMEAKIIPARGTQGAPVLTRNGKQAKRAHHIGLKEALWTVDGAIDVAFGRQVQHRVGIVLRKDPAQSCAITDINGFKSVVRMISDAAERRQICGVGEPIDVDDETIGRLQELPDRGRADKTGAARHKDAFHHLFSLGTNSAPNTQRAPVANPT